jgi:hypothetical protein
LRHLPGSLSIPGCVLKGSELVQNSERQKVGSARLMALFVVAVGGKVESKDVYNLISAERRLKLF